MYRFDDVQIRLIILYALKAYRLSAAEGDLTAMLAWTEILDYFTLMDFVLIMEDDEMITSVMVDGQKRYDIAPKGEEALELFYDKIPWSVREIIDESAEKALDFLERGIGITATVEPYDMRRFSAKCCVQERGLPMMELSLMAGSRRQAKKMAEVFEKQAAEIYQMLLEKVMQEEGGNDE